MSSYDSEASINHNEWKPFFPYPIDREINSYHLHTYRPGVFVLFRYLCSSRFPGESYEWEVWMGKMEMGMGMGMWEIRTKQTANGHKFWLFIAWVWMVLSSRVSVSDIMACGWLACIFFFMLVMTSFGSEVWWLRMRQEGERRGGNQEP